VHIGRKTFWILIDLKSKKKRNKLPSTCINATSIKSALNMRSETVINMKINEKHLFIISAGKLYVTAIIKKDKI